MKIDFETINELKAARRKAGQLERTKGKNSVNDGLGGIYLIQTPAQFGGTPDEINDFAIANGNIARFLKSNVQINNTEAQVRGANDGFIDLSPRIPRLIDGRFDFWYEGNGPQTTSGYGSDTMWINDNFGSAKSHTREDLTLGVDIPSVPTAKFYSRTVVTSVAGAPNRVSKIQRIESVRTYAAQTITISFFARVDTIKNIALSLEQQFGPGGSSPVVGIGAQKIQIGTSFQRYEAVFTLPSIAGKTITTTGLDNLSVRFWFDAGSDFDSQTDNLGQQSGTFDLACIQDDIGSSAKPFYEFDFKENQDRVFRHFETNYEQGQIGMNDTSRRVRFQWGTYPAASNPDHNVYFSVAKEDRINTSDITIYSTDTGASDRLRLVFNSSALALGDYDQNVPEVSRLHFRTTKSVSETAANIAGSTWEFNWVCDLRIP